MYTKLFVAIAIIALLTLVGIGVYLLMPGESETDPRTTPGPFTERPIIPLFPSRPGSPGGGSVTTVATTTLPVVGGTLFITDFVRSPVATTSPDGSYVVLAPLENDSIPRDEFEIVYFIADHSFVISILKEPIGDARRYATEFLMRELDIPSIDVCRLVAEVTLPRGVSDRYEGVSLGFPGCPGAVALPGD